VVKVTARPGEQARTESGGRPLFVGAALFDCEQPTDDRSFAELVARAVPPGGPFFILRFIQDGTPPFVRITSAAEMASFLPWWEKRLPPARVGAPSEDPTRRYGFEHPDRQLSVPLDYAREGFEWPGSKHPGVNQFATLGAHLYHGIGFTDLDFGSLLVSDTYGLRDVGQLNTYMGDLLHTTKRLCEECRPAFCFRGGRSLAP